MTETVGFLLERYEGKGYHLYQDNYYNSVHQTNALLQKLIRVCGTIRVNCGLPEDMIDEAKKLKKGEVPFHRNHEILLISHHIYVFTNLLWFVNTISTHHTAEVIKTTSRRMGVAKKKTKCIIDYNTLMHGVDTAVQYLAYYPFIRKTVKWPKKVFFYLLQRCLSNSYVTFSKDNPNSRISFLDFMSDITENLIHTPSSTSDESQGSSRTPTPTPTKRAPKNDPPGRLDRKLKNHKLVHIPPTK